MKKYLLVITALIFSQHITVAQNMVTNGSFEQHSSCPDGADQLDKASGWSSGTMGTSDYYNECATISNLDVPDNYLGYQHASGGVAYSGIAAYVDNAPESVEYLRNVLQPLIPGHSYKVSMKISLADQCMCGVNGIGAYFYTQYLDADTISPVVLNVQPQVDFNDPAPITERTDWITLTDTLVADSAYQYLMIGRFKNSADVDTAHVTFGVSYCFIYYYIDEVSITDLNPASVASANTIRNTSLSPNPLVTSTTLTFSNSQQRSHVLNIFSVDGKSVRRIENIHTDYVTIERNDLAAGCYFYELKSEDGAVAKGKLFVQ